MQQYILQIIYLIASVTFILGLKYLGNPATARKGNLIAAFGMGIAIFGTIFLYTDANGQHLENLGFIFGALLVGSVVGVFSFLQVSKTYRSLSKQVCSLIFNFPSLSVESMSTPLL